MGWGAGEDKPTGYCRLKSTVCLGGAKDRQEGLTGGEMTWRGGENGEDEVGWWEGKEQGGVGGDMVGKDKNWWKRTRWGGRDMVA